MTDSLRLAVTGSHGHFQVEVYVNGVDMAPAGAGAGMDPYDLLVPANRFVATAQPETVSIARCECGSDCAVTDVSLYRDGDVVRWDWVSQASMDRSVSFDAREYDAEVARVAANHAWETPERTAGRLVLRGLDRLLVHRPRNGPRSSLNWKSRPRSPARRGVRSGRPGDPGVPQPAHACG